MKGLYVLRYSSARFFFYFKKFTAETENLLMELVERNFQRSREFQDNALVANDWWRWEVFVNSPVIYFKMRPSYTLLCLCHDINCRLIIFLSFSGVICSKLPENLQDLMHVVYWNGIYVHLPPPQRFFVITLSFSLFPSLW